MVNIQLERLNRSLLRHPRSGRALLVTEPLSLSRKKLETLRVGDRIDLGSEPLELFIREGERYRYHARLVEREGDEACLLEGRASSWPLTERVGKKRVVVEGRLALLPEGELRRGALFPFPWRVSEHIHLFEGERSIASASLIRHDGGYALKITELHDGR